MKAHINYRKLNNLLLTAIIAVNSYIIVTPFVPKLTAWWQFNHTARVEQLKDKVVTPTSDLETAPSMEPTLIIPSAAIETTIHEASFNDRYQALREGVWRNPRASMPSSGGNTVLAGHRFTYRQPQSVFYNLDRVQLNDTIGLRWEGQMHIYTVTAVLTVSPNDTQIEAPTSDSRLTIYTCTPLFKPTERLVIIAKELT